MKEIGEGKMDDGWRVVRGAGNRIKVKQQPHKMMYFTLERFQFRD